MAAPAKKQPARSTAHRPDDPADVAERDRANWDDSNAQGTDQSEMAKALAHAADDLSDEERFGAPAEQEEPIQLGAQDGETVTFTAPADFGPAYYGNTEVHLKQGVEYTVSAEIAAWLEHDGYVIEDDDEDEDATPKRAAAKKKS